ncbi:GNAT family N-acetyltransferase [Enterococcus sp. LJL120]
MFTYQKFTSQAPAYQQALSLRDKLLRQPLGKSIYDEDLLIEAENDFYGVFIGEQLIGTVSWFKVTEQTAHLTAFAVAEAYQQRGLGSCLLDFLVADLLERGFQLIEVDARQTALEFYQKNGFQKISGPVGNATGAIDFQMVRRLA